ncbi:Peptidoglycan/LPS O-acetylase OafA/YrhL, contains acyltransferase and SGNH-hydrolase domains [Geodermatophilus dictyosporus]|uniref:Peptidoglycan/LPS O-acetylase OafA/YrhL, contains acyltransferase and SGNH-hydrolase domains n=1 Tax=Geodermatophilus dictyosporus TaxID=1523247 RepID=A0A1I5LBR6_9ACTN|nr:acyltransferase [Geodermatophilus dictyosporus]SFO94623.1 Peptidoglycan/LPS O-acetylase OafA/YrhL, contains acyltransferase and SGNH-hydrolase domains [Geodermatophilus dictyosporus]
MPARDGARQAPRCDIRSLTGLRFVAATWVVLLHFEPYAGAYLDQLPLLRAIVSAGWTGVELFFVLSGFVLTLNYADRMGRRLRVRATLEFALNRFARVWPAWAAVTVLMGAWIWAVRAAGWSSDVVVPHPPVDVRSVLEQLTMTQMWGRQDLPGASFVLPGWSISAEWAAYLAFPLVVFVLFRLRRLPATVLLALSVAAMAPLFLIAVNEGRSDLDQHWGLRIACGFTAGALAALAVRRTRRTPRTDALAPVLTWVAVVLIVAGALWASWRQAGDWGHKYSGVVVVLFPLLVVGLSLTDRGPARWLSSDTCVYGGKISYALYLVHFVVLDVTITCLWQDESRGQTTAELALAVPALVVGSFVAAAALHHGVEEPARRLLLRRLGRRLVPAPAVQVPAPRIAAVRVPAPPATLLAPALLAPTRSATGRPRPASDRSRGVLRVSPGQGAGSAVLTDTVERPGPVRVRPSA